MSAPRPTMTPVGTVAADDRRALVALRGELDVSVAPTLAAEIEAHLAAGRRYLRADCSAVDFVDSAIIGVLLRCHQAALAQRGTLIITGVGPSLARLLELLALDRVLFTSPVTAGEYVTTSQYLTTA